MRDVINEIIGFLSWFRSMIKNKKCSIPESGDERIVIVGNGPSAKLFPYEKIRNNGFKFCCVNFMGLNKDLFLRIRPEYYCIIDPLFFENDDREDDRVIQLLQAFESVEWKITLICYKESMHNINNKNIRYAFINRNTYGGILNKFKVFLYMNNKATPGLQNVVVAAVYYFLITKSEVIVMTGVEMDWFRECAVDIDNNAYESISYCYGKSKNDLSKLRIVNKGEFYLYFYYVYLTFLSFYHIDKLAGTSDTRIYNACTDSLLDMFKKVKEDELAEL